MFEKTGKFKLFIVNSDKLENKFSISKEIQADSLAFELLLRSGYDPSSYIEVLKLVSFYEQKQLRKNKYLNYLDETTHPSTEKRIDIYTNKLKHNSHQKGGFFLISQEQFNYFKKQSTTEILKNLLEKESYTYCQELSFKYHIINPTEPIYYYYLLESIRRFCYGNPKLWTELFITSNYFYDSKAKTLAVIKKQLDYSLLKKFDPIALSIIPEDTNKIIAKFYWNGEILFSTYEEAYNYFYRISQRFGANECILSNALSYSSDTASKNHYLRKYLSINNIKHYDYANSLLKDSIYSSLSDKKIIILNKFVPIIRIGKNDVPIYPSSFENSDDLKPIIDNLALELPNTQIINLQDIRKTNIELYYSLYRMMIYSFALRISYNEIVETHILFPEYYSVFKEFGVNEIEFVNMLYFEAIKEPKDINEYWKIVRKTVKDVMSDKGSTKYLDITISGIRICNKRSSMYVSRNEDIKLSSNLTGYENVFNTLKHEYYYKEEKLKKCDSPSRRIN